jgi:DnaK suppressor protein
MNARPTARSRLAGPGFSWASLDRLLAVLRTAREDEVAEVLACRAGGGARSEPSLVEVVECHMAVEAGRRAIADIDDALARLAAGTYGACEQCGAAISFERLAAIPQTPSCGRCCARRSDIW